MRIINLLWRFSLGGIGKCALTYARLGEVSEIEVKTVCIQNTDNSCDLSALRQIGATIIPIKNRLDFSWLSKCSDLIESFDTDLIFVHGFNGPVVATLLRWWMKNRVPFVCSYHGRYHATTLPRLFLQPLFNKVAERIYCKHAEGIVTVADFCRKQLVDNGVAAKKITVIHNGLSQKDFSFSVLAKSEFGLSEKDLTIGFIGRLDPVKGLGYLIDAFAKISNEVVNARLVLVGAGSSEKSLRKKAESLRLSDKILFAGYQKNTRSWLDMIDIFVLPSLAEYHSISLLEAMRSGKAIVATGVGGNTESVRERMEALVVPPKDSAALSSAILKLASDEKLRNRLGDAAKKRFENNFTEEKNMRDLSCWLKTFQPESVSG